MPHETKAHRRLYVQVVQTANLNSDLFVARQCQLLQKEVHPDCLFVTASSLAFLSSMQ